MPILPILADKYVKCLTESLALSAQSLAAAIVTTCWRLPRGVNEGQHMPGNVLRMQLFKT